MADAHSSFAEGSNGFFPKATESAASLQECLFEMEIDSLKYCFTLKKYGLNGKQYTVYAILSPATEDSISYSIDIGIALDVNKKRFITNPTGTSSNIKMKKPKGGGEILIVPTKAFLAAWEEVEPSDGRSRWDFVVLKVSDDIQTNEKKFPRYIVMWMGEHVLPSSEVAGKKIATFVVNLSAINEVLGFNNPKYGYYEKMKDFPLANERLQIEHVKKLTSDKKPIKISETGFDDQTYIGNIVKTPLPGIGVPFDAAAGHENPNSKANPKSYYVTLHVPEPPATVDAKFKTSEFDIPKGLEPDSMAVFNQQSRLLLMYLNDNQEVSIEIYAYTDAVGKKDYNEKLSNARASSAKKYFANNAIWTGLNGTPLALTESRIKKAEGMGVAPDANAQKKNDVDSRKFIIKYIVQ